jgi:hypothetical protein
MVGSVEVVVDGLWNANAPNIPLIGVTPVADPVDRVHRVVSADVEEVPDVVFPQELSDTRQILVPQLVPTRPQCRTRGEAQRLDILMGQSAEIDGAALHESLDGETHPEDSAPAVCVVAEAAPRAA